MIYNNQTPSHPAVHLRGEFLYGNFLARINARVQVLLRQEFGIPSGNVRVLSADFHGRERGGLKSGRKKSVGWRYYSLSH